MADTTLTRLCNRAHLPLRVVFCFLARVSSAMASPIRSPCMTDSAPTVLE